MVVIGCFNRHFHTRKKQLRTAERTVVHDLLNARAGSSDRSRQLGNAAGAVAHLRGKSPESAVDNQAVLNHSVQNREIDVAATQQQNNFFSN